MAGHGPWIVPSGVPHERELTRPPHGAPEPGSPQAYPVAAASCTAAAVLLVLFLRRPESFLHPQFFAEDGAVFYMGANRAPWGSILSPYAGHLHLASRLVATLSSGADPLWMPAIYFAASIAAVLSLTLALFSRRLGLPFPALLALGVVLVPHNGEVFDSLTDLQWILALGFIVLMLARDPQGPGQWLVDLGFASIASLSGVFSILFAPFFVLRAASRRTPAAAATACLVCAGAAIQAHEVLASPVPATPNSTPPILVLATFGHRVWLALLSTPALSDSAPVRARAAAGAAGLALLALLVLGMSASRPRRMVLAASLLLIVAAAIYRFRGELYLLGTVRNGDRYFFVPKVCLVWMLVLHLRPACALRWLSGAMLAALLVNSCLTFRFEPRKDYHWPYWAGRIATGERVVVPINPEGWEFVYDGQGGAAR